MAGDWIKWEHGLARKPEVRAMARRLKVHRQRVAGALMEVWEWADVTTSTGRVLGVTLEDIDDVAQLPLLAREMCAERWLKVIENGVSFPNFRRHNGAPAKRRALEQKRKQRERASRNEADKKRTRARARARAREEVDTLFDLVNVSLSKEIVTQLKDYATRTFADVYSTRAHALLFKVAFMRVAGVVSDDFVEDGLEAVRRSKTPKANVGGYLRKVWRESSKGPAPAASDWFEKCLRQIKLPEGLK